MAKKTFHRTKGAGCRVIHHNLKKYSGISLPKIDDILSSMPLHQQLRKRFSNKAPIRPVIAFRVMERLQIDLVNKQTDVISYKGKKYLYILSILDVFSRYTWLFPLQSKASEIISAVFKRFFSDFGKPDIVQNDQGSEFKGDVARLLKQLSIKQIMSSPYHPQSQGKVERMHRSLKSIMKYECLTTKSVNWVEQIPKYQQIINDRPKECLAMQCPFEVFFGRRRKGMSSLSADLIREKAFNATKKINERTIRRQEQSLKTPTYKVGDKVLIKLDVKVSRVTTRQFHSKGKILKRNLKLYKYKIKYRKDKVMDIKWFHIKDILGRTKCLQKNRERNNETALRKNLLKPMTHKDRIDNLVSTSELNISFNPVGDGNCLFRAIAYQLGRSESYHMELRQRVVQHLFASPHLGQQSTISWHDSLSSENAWAYLNRMALDGTYADHIALQAMAEVLNTQILIVSSINHGTTLIRADGRAEFDPNSEFIVLGHLAEGYGDHYVAMEQDLDRVIRVIVSSSQVALLDNSAMELYPLTSTDNFIDSMELNLAEETSESRVKIEKRIPKKQVCEPAESLTFHFATAIKDQHTGQIADEARYWPNDSEGTKQCKRSELLSLPNELIVIIIGLAISGSDILTYQRLLQTSCRIAAATKVYPIPSSTFYVRPDIQFKMPSNEVSIRKLISLSGRYSGLIQQIQIIMHNCKNWINAWLMVEAMAHGWYKIASIYWRTGSRK